MTTEAKTFYVHEHFNGFELEHVASGKRHWLSDGVDVFGCCRKRFPFKSGSGDFIEALICGQQLILRYVAGGTADDRFSGKTGDYVAGPLPVSLFSEIVVWFNEPYATEEYMSPGDPEFRGMWEDMMNSDESECMQAYFPELVET